jgi:hypothetical protein
MSNVWRMSYQKKKLDKIEQAIKNGHSRDIGNIGHKTLNEWHLKQKPQHRKMLYTYVCVHGIVSASVSTFCILYL